MYSPMEISWSVVVVVVVLLLATSLTAGELPAVEHDSVDDVAGLELK